MKKYGQCVFLVVLFLAFLGCDLGFSHPYDLPSTGTPPTGTPPTGTPPSGDLPIKFIFWERGTDGFYQFYTNDPHDLNCGFFSLFDFNNSNIFEYELKKISGARNAAYGMIFGAVDFDNMYYIKININGRYCIGKSVNRSDTTIQGWTDSSKLRTGFNVSNTIRVTKSGSTFQVSFNGSNEYSFTDSSIRGNGIGPIAYVGSSQDESFPNTPVVIKVR